MQRIPTSRNPNIEAVRIRIGFWRPIITLLIIRSTPPKKKKKKQRSGNYLGPDIKPLNKNQGFLTHQAPNFEGL